jgi:hypothetical protein
VAVGVSGVTAGNLAAINSALNSAGVNGVVVETTAEIQTLVNSYAAILGSADVVNNLVNGSGPTQAQYAAIGVTGVDSAVKTNLLGDAIDGKTSADVDTGLKCKPWLMRWAR